MKRAISHARAAGALILIGLAACDNVNWGGADVAIVPPPPQARTEAPVEAGDSAVQRLPEGPILYYVAPSGGTGTMVPIAEIAGDSLRSLHGASDPQAFAARFISEHMRQGAEFVLFREGNRVGTMILQSAEVAQGGETCPAVPRATGSLELNPTAAGAREFLALSKLSAPQTAGGVAQPLATSRNMQVVAPIIAERLMRARRAGLPGNWQRAMAQLQPFPVSGMQQPGYATTFLVGDTLGPGLDNDGYSMFYIGIPSEASYDTAFVDYRPYPEGGKAAPRVIDFLDWDRDEQVELLLQVYGVSEAWFEAVGNVDGDWQRIFSERCQIAPQRAPASVTDTTR